jgi:hypothetical protein
MIWIAAFSIVAFVQYTKGLVKIAIVNKPRQLACDNSAAALFASVHTPVSVSVKPRRPIPAIVGFFFFYLCPKSFKKSFRKALRGYSIWARTNFSELHSYVCNLLAVFGAKNATNRAFNLSLNQRIASAI